MRKKKLVPYTQEFEDALDCVTDEDSSPIPRNKENHVGVELECLSKLDRRAVAANLVMAGLQDYCTVKYDSSIDLEGHHEYDVEVCVIAPQKKIYSVVKKVCKVLKSIGCKVNKSCGLHVHLDMRTRQEKKAFKNLVTNLPKLEKMVTKSRIDGSFCRRNKTVDLDLVLNANSYNYYDESDEQIPYSEHQAEPFEEDRYLAINPWSLEKHNTIEVRMHQGSIDATRINKWIKTLVTVVDKKAA